MEKILIVDDNEANLELIGHLLETGGFKYDMANSGMEALVKMEKEGFQLVISDLMMPHMNGIQLLGKIKESWPETEFLIVTAHGSVKSAVEAIKKGAYGYILKPFEQDEIISEVEKVIRLIKIRNENKALKMELARVKHTNTMIGDSPQIKAVYELVQSVAKTSATILIQGDSGTGKELVANAIHNTSDRKNNPFVTVACATLAETLLESELFGHEKGSFTGAVSQKKGRFEIAHTGTIFLDEIGEISPAVQVKLLRVLQEKEFERVGGTRLIKIDVRIIAATNRELTEEVKKGNFREDLFYRLNVISIKLPTLRERKSDINQLAEYFLQKYRAELNKPVNTITEKAIKCLTEYSWPGNIRELENVIERAVVLSATGTVDVGDLPDNVREDMDRLTVYEGEAIPPLKEAKRKFEKQYLKKALSANKGNISRTAGMIKLARKNLQDKIKTYDIDVGNIIKKTK